MCLQTSLGKSASAVDDVRASNVRIVERAQFDRREDDGKEGMDLVGGNAGMSGSVSGRKGSQPTVFIIVLVGSCQRYRPARSRLHVGDGSCCLGDTYSVHIGRGARQGWYRELKGTNV